MKKFIIIAILLCSCQSGYYLRRAKVNTLRAIANGAKIDSVTQSVHDTLYIDPIHDKVTNVTKVDTVKLKTICPEVTTRPQIKSLQKIVCPEVTKDTTYAFNVNVQGKKYHVGIHIVASSIDGATSLQVDSKDLDIPFIKQETKVNLQPGNSMKWRQIALIGFGCLIVGIIIGKII